MLRKLARYTKGYGIYILLGVLCSVGESVLELELPQAMSEIVDVGIATGNRSYILLTGLKMFLMAMAALACGVSSWGNSWLYCTTMQPNPCRRATLAA